MRLVVRGNGQVILELGFFSTQPPTSAGELGGVAMDILEEIGS